MIGPWLHCLCICVKDNKLGIAPASGLARAYLHGWIDGRKLSYSGPVFSGAAFATGRPTLVALTRHRKVYGQAIYPAADRHDAGMVGALRSCTARTHMNKTREPGTGGGDRRSLKIFVIEDNVVLRQLIIEALNDIPLVDIVFYADNEVSATNWLSSNDSAWDLAVVDLHLRQGSGVGALSWCTTRRPDQRVVVLSGELSDEIRRQCIALHADAVFDKATEMNDFLDYCRALAA